MPARKIPKNYRNITGKVVLAHAQSSTVGFESSLERDFILMKDFDERVLNIEEQPATINYIANERNHKYTPDFLVTYSDRPAELVEIKYTEDLEIERVEHPIKFQSAEEFARARGWVFAFYTESEIRSPRLKNISFLRNYISDTIHYPHTELIQHILKTTERTITVEELLLLASNDKYRQAEVLSSLWHLAATREIELDLEAPLSNKTEILEIRVESSTIKA